MKVLHVNDIESLLGKIDLIDIREVYEYENRSLEHSKNIPMGDLLNDPSKYLSKEKQQFIICESGGRSSMACGYLEKIGYNVVNVAGGVSSYVGTKIK